MKNYYKVLGVSQTARIEEITKAYKLLAQQYSPEKNRGDKYAEERFIDISVAYKTLADAEKRIEYDRILNDILLEVDGDIKLAKQQVAPGNRQVKVLPVYFVTIFFFVIALAFFLFQNKGKREDTVNDSFVDTIVTPIEAVVTVDTAVNKVLSNDTLSERLTKKTDLQVSIEKPLNKVKSKKDSSLTIKRVLSDAEDTIKQRDIIDVGVEKKVVLRIQGTPSSITAYGNSREIWNYGKSTILFVDGKVMSYKNGDNNLRLGNVR